VSREWPWIELATVLAIHEEQLQQHGGGIGIRDIGLLESALARPQQLATYEQPDVCALAAAYAHGIARNHPFVDGNKRTAWVVARVFLLLNGLDRTASDEDSYITMMHLAAGDMTQEEFTAWLRANMASAAT
jgi:death on curing protein